MLDDDVNHDNELQTATLQPFPSIMIDDLFVHSFLNSSKIQELQLKWLTLSRITVRQILRLNKFKIIYQIKEEKLKIMFVICQINFLHKNLLVVYHFIG